MSNTEWFALLCLTVITILLIFAFVWALRFVKAVGRELGEPVTQPYTIAVARFPDALLLPFGVAAAFRDLPARVSVTYVAWATMNDNLARNFVSAVYANRRTVASFQAENPRVTPREKTLCIYRGFSISVAKQFCPVGSDGTVRKAESLEELAAILSKGRILAMANTDQVRALEKVYTRDLRLNPDKHIVQLADGSDVLEEVLKNAEPKMRDLPIIGFSAGITERVVGAKIGWPVVANQELVLTHEEEFNSFVYMPPHTVNELTDLGMVLSQLEALWDDTVRRVVRDREVRDSFRAFLNQNLRERLGVATLKSLADQKPFTSSDVDDLLERWISFPCLGPQRVNSDATVAAAA